MLEIDNIDKEVIYTEDDFDIFLKRYYSKKNRPMAVFLCNTG